MRNRADLSKLVFYAVIAMVVLGVPYLAGLYSAYYQNAPFRAIKEIKDQIDLVREEWSTLRQQEPTHFLQPSKHDGSGVTVNRTESDDLIMLASFFDGNNVFRLIRRDGTVVAKWPASFKAHFPDLL